MSKYAIATFIVCWIEGFICYLIGYMVGRTHAKRTITHECVKTNADQHVQRVEYVGNVERCRKCKHIESEHQTPIASDGKYYTYVVCTAKECNYELKDEPQTCSVNGRPYDCGKCEYFRCTADEPQTETQNSNKNSNVISVYDGVSEAVRCAMCSNTNKSNRGCDGACSYDEKLYKRIMDAIDKSRADTPQTERPCDNCQEFDCYGCEYKQTEREGE